jgi:glycerol-3-phosphate dehydrogenase
LADRSQRLEALASGRHDLLVIGGGIIGAGIAAQAARLGLAVALVERGDFGSATSSASSKLVHGGLRYLRLGDVGLVRESQQERRILQRVVAPHLVRPIPFLLPLYRGGPHRPATVQAGIWVYSALARERLGGLVGPRLARERVPALRIDGLRACGFYGDAWTNDSRLCLETVQAAALAGAAVLNYAEATALETMAGRAVGAVVEDRLGGGTITVAARAVVNATGPWVDRVRRLEDRSAAPSSRLSKGVHVVLPLEDSWSAALTIPHDPVRVSFAVPWEGMLLLGTTDTLYEGDPGALEATQADVQVVLGEASLAVEESLLDPASVRASFAGLRVLPGRDGETASTRRETVYLRGKAGMLSVAGGKLTTHRRIALEALGQLASDLGLHGIDETPAPLPGARRIAAAEQSLAHSPLGLEPAVRAHLLHLYGSAASEVVALAERDRSLLEPLHPEAPDIAAQAVYAGRAEWAETAEDVLRRRTTLALKGLATSRVAARVERLLVSS